MVGQRIRVLRKRAAKSQDQLAEEAGVTSSHLGGVERGQHNPSLEMLGRIADALGVTLAGLVDDDSEEVAALRQAVVDRAKLLTAAELQRLLDQMDKTAADKARALDSTAPPR